MSTIILREKKCFIVPTAANLIRMQKLLVGSLVYAFLKSSIKKRHTENR